MKEEPFEEETNLFFKLKKDLKQAAATLTDREARFLVDTYYCMQGNRVRSASQARSLDKGDEPHQLVTWLEERNRYLEAQVKGALTVYAESKHMGRWAMEIVGIGPIIAAGLLAHINLEPWKCAYSMDAKKTSCNENEPHGPECHRIIVETVGHIWSYAGLDPTKKWLPKHKRPWNAQLKVLCWKAGESFVKVSGKDKDVYGKLYLQRKAIEIEKNEQGLYKEQAALMAEKVGKGTEAIKYYKEGLLPPGHIHARAKRYAVKIFLSHWHAEAYRDRFGKEPPKPFAIAILGHAHMIEPPNQKVATIESEPKKVRRTARIERAPNI
jgi:hypothetical protein